MNSIEINGWQKEPSIAAIVRATFPGYKRKKVYVRASETVSIYGLNWEGGSRNEYRACTVNGVHTGGMDEYHQYAPWDSRQVHNAQVPIPTGMIVVQGGHFCGKESILTLHVNPADMPKYLPKPIS